jgi:hypothetical protein
MAKASDYRIVTFQRKPGQWRANISPVVTPATVTRGAILGFVTSEDSNSEEGATIAANRAIRELDS